MSQSITLVVFEDPGHAWVRFSKKRLAELGIADKISPYSYQNGANAFIEEDCDLSTLANALRERGYEIKYMTNRTDRQSKIRNFDRYHYE
jgi:N-acetyl-anhydromuramyl-L-alanine amidase AmpD